VSTVREIPISDFIRRMAALDGDVEAAVVRGLQSAAMRFDGMVAHEIQHAQPHPAVDRGELLNSRELLVTPKGATFALTAPHAAAMENGTRPFRPPFKAIYEWLLRKKLVPEDEARSRAWAICNAIAKHGIKPRHMVSKAWARFVNGKYVGRAVGKELELLAQQRERGRVGQATRRGSRLREKKGS
jgi:hypothetical protein